MVFLLTVLMACIFDKDLSIDILIKFLNRYGNNQLYMVKEIKWIT